MDGVIHFEIPAENVKRAQGFYKKAFGWRMNEMPEMEYTILMTTEINKKTMRPKEPGIINGGMLKRGKLVKGPVITINVDSIEAALKKVVKQGGKVARGKMSVGGMGWNAYFTDTEGNLIGLWQSNI